jgi:predicted nucleic acid-binding Zn ribbon protein
MKKCLYSKCGKEFEPNKPKQKFCSDKCRVYWNRQRGGLKTVTTLDGTKIQMYVPVAHAEPIEVPKINYTPTVKKTFNQLLTDAKNGTLDMKEVDAARLPPNQQELIMRKFKTN